MVILGVPSRHAIAGLQQTFRRVSGLTAAELAPYFDANAQLPVGRAIAVPGKGRAAFTRVAAARGDVGLVVAVSTTDPKVAVPDAAELSATTVKIARAIAD